MTQLNITATVIHRTLNRASVELCIPAGAFDINGVVTFDTDNDLVVGHFLKESAPRYADITEVARQAL